MPTVGLFHSQYWSEAAGGAPPVVPKVRSYPSWQASVIVAIGVVLAVLLIH